MAITKQKKEELITEMSDVMKDSPSVVFIHSTGLGVNESNELRAKLDDDNSKYKVVKKTLLNRVLGEAKIEGEQPPLDGEISIAYGEDLMAPAREIFNFHKQHKDQMNIIGGIFEGQFKSQEEMTEIANIPDLQQLRGMFVNIINSPIQGFVSVLGQVAEKRG